MQEKIGFLISKSEERLAILQEDLLLSTSEIRKALQFNLCGLRSVHQFFFKEGEIAQKIYKYTESFQAIFLEEREKIQEGLSLNICSGFICHCRLSLFFCLLEFLSGFLFICMSVPFFALLSSSLAVCSCLMFT